MQVCACLNWSFRWASQERAEGGIIATLVCGWTQNICGKKTGYLEGGLENTDLAQNKMKSCR